MARPKPPHPGQLDVFLDSGETAFFNEFAAALKQRDATRSGKLLWRLAADLPDHPKLPAYQTLCLALREWPFPTTDPAAIAAAVARLESEVSPAAQAILGRSAGKFLEPLWRGLAEAAAPYAYDAAFPQAFGAGLWLRCGEFQAAAEAVEAADGWENQPDLLCWLCLARYGLGGLDECRPLLLRLALVDPSRSPELVEALGDARLDREWRSFQTACGWLEGGGSAGWFPAWYGLAHPGLRSLPGPFPVSLEAKVCALVLRLNVLEGQGASGELATVQKRLRELAPELFEIYMRHHEA